MRVAITADAPDENSPVSPIFGRCAYYAIYDTATEKLEFVPNTAGMYARGAGVQAAQQVASLGVQMLITAGIVGPNASMAISQAGIEIVNSFQGTIRDAVEAVKSGRIRAQPIPPAVPPAPSYPPMSKEEELRMLEEEKEYIEKRLEEIKKRLEELKE
jgi:predicted Fe-Mo cluster-binding NifX family protein